MKTGKMMFVMVGLVAIALIAADAEAFRVTTADAGGADAELRESQPTTARGTGTEIASRIAQYFDDFGVQTGGKNSVIYLKFSVSDISATDLAGDITVRTTYRNTNLSVNRIEDLAGGGANTGFDYFVLDPTTAGADWDEETIAPTTAAGVVQAPGYTYDGDFGTKPTDNSALTYLGQKLYDSADLVGGHMPVGGAFDFTLSTGSALHTAIEEAQASDYQYVTIVMGIAHEADNINGGNWLNFNYLFNPKEQTTLNGDPTSPWDGMANDASTGYAFSPMLTNEPHIPEPATIALLGLGGLLLRRKRK